MIMIMIMMIMMAMILMILMMLMLVSRVNLNTMEGADISLSPSLCAGLT